MSESANTYAPKPGTVAYRVMAWLETQPHGTEVSTAPLAEAIGVEPSHIGACMQAALAAGIVFARKREPGLRAPLWWSLVDHAKQRAAAPPSVARALPAEPRAEAPAAPGPSADNRRAVESHVDNRTLVGVNATASMSGQIAIVAECGTVVLFEGARAAQLRRFLGGAAA